jgi:hypothetical protein
MYVIWPCYTRLYYICTYSIPGICVICIERIYLPTTLICCSRKHFSRGGIRLHNLNSYFWSQAASNTTLKRDSKHRSRLSFAIQGCSLGIIYLRCPPNGRPNNHLESRFRVGSLPAYDQKYELWISRKNTALSSVDLSSLQKRVV